MRIKVGIGFAAILLLSFASDSVVGQTSRPVDTTTRPLATKRATTLSASRPTSRKSTASAAAESRDAVRAAVAALSREYRDYCADPKAHPLRGSCNYFDKESAAKISVDVLLASLGPKSGDVRASAYIDWQLLSALPHSLDASGAGALLSAYHFAPLPIPRPGVSETDQQKLEHVFKGKAMADEADVKEAWQATLDANAADNEPILAYRDELYHRLPQGFDTFAAAFDDLYARMNAVVDARAAVKSVAADVRSWTASVSADSATPEQLAALARAARKLADSKGPQYYGTPYWRASSDAFVWRKTRSGIETGHVLKDLAEFLDEQSRQPSLKIAGKDVKIAKETKDNHGH